MIPKICTRTVLGKSQNSQAQQEQFQGQYRYGHQSSQMRQNLDMEGHWARFLVHRTIVYPLLELFLLHTGLENQYLPISLRFCSTRTAHGPMSTSAKPTHTEAGAMAIFIFNVLAHFRRPSPITSTDATLPYQYRDRYSEK